MLRTQLVGDLLTIHAYRSGKSLKSRVALQVARKIAMCDRALTIHQLTFSDISQKHR